MAWASHGLGNRTDFSAGVVAASVASLLINWVRPDDSTGTLAMLLDLAVSLWVSFWTATYAVLRIGTVVPSVARWFSGDRPGPSLIVKRPASTSSVRTWVLAAAIVGTCTVEWYLHGGAMNPFQIGRAHV